jgi:purine-binding chemotaxis protein CheW
MYLAFRVGAAEYALPVLMVTEIVRLPTWHPLPDVPPHICGVVNLRSRVVPIMDLRMRFGLGAHKATERTVVVVVEIDGVATGLLVDGVSDVVEFAEIDEVRAGVGRSELLRGVAKKGERVVFVLDALALLSPVSITTQAA